MWSHLYAKLDQALGLGSLAEDLTFSQMSLRAVVVFVAAVAILRIGHKRVFAQRNTLDVILALIIASVLSRAINGDAPLFPTIGASFGLVILHRVFAWGTAMFPWLGALLKGRADPLIKEGVVDEGTLRKRSISRHDLEEDLRLAGVERPELVRKATLERNGQISVIRECTPVSDVGRG